MLDILHGSGAVVEPGGVDQDQSSYYFDSVRDDTIENITKEFKPESMDSDLPKNQHDYIEHVKYIKEVYVNLPEFDSSFRVGQ